MSKRKKASGLNVHHYKSTLRSNLTINANDDISLTILDIEKTLKINDEKVKAILTSMADDGKKNYDTSNQLHLHSILPILWKAIKTNPDGCQLLKDELTAMLRGGCPQGRVVRIYQLYVAFCT
jgi:hypothetical protein